MTVGVVVPCYRQERFLPRTVAAIEAALAGRDWRGALVLSAPGESTPLPALRNPWQVLRPPVTRPLTPGAARNLGFAACGGAWVLFVDADVEVDAAWLERALATVAGDPSLAGAWGRLEEWFVDAAGERPGSRDLYRVGDADRDSDYLATLALYRREALERAGGYEPRLNSEEDFELGLRLRAAGLRLRSLAPRAGRHWSAPRPSFAEIGRRWRHGLCFGQGQVLRLYLGRAGLGAHVRRQAHYFATLALWLSAPLALALGGTRGLAAWLLAPLALLAVMAMRKRSVRLALHSLLTWTVNAAGLVVGFVRGGARGQSGLANPEVAC
jgi:glycosyltransferase involved in cell wall biosynthesis